MSVLEGKAKTPRRLGLGAEVSVGVGGSREHQTIDPPASRRGEAVTMIMRASGHRRHVVIVPPGDPRAGSSPTPHRVTAVGGGPPGPRGRPPRGAVAQRAVVAAEGRSSRRASRGTGAGRSVLILAHDVVVRAVGELRRRPRPCRCTRRGRRRSRDVLVILVVDVPSYLRRRSRSAGEGRPASTGNSAATALSLPPRCRRSCARTCP